MKLESLPKIQEKIRQKVMAENLLTAKELSNALAAVPAMRIWADIQHVYHNVLPAIEKKTGVDSEQYKIFRGIVDSLIWAMHILTKYEQQILKIGNLQFENQLLREKLSLTERELLNYTTVEQLIKTDTLQDYAKAILKQAENMLNEKTK